MILLVRDYDPIPVLGRHPGKGEIGMAKVIYVLRGGYGKDGGFGDYANPDFDELLTDVNGDLVWFEDKDKAHELAKSLNGMEWDAFYGTDDDGDYPDYAFQYSGFFPWEWRVFKSLIPGPESSDALPIDDLAKNTNIHEY